MSVAPAPSNSATMSARTGHSNRILRANPDTGNSMLNLHHSESEEISDDEASDDIMSNHHLNPQEIGADHDLSDTDEEAIHPATEKNELRLTLSHKLADSHENILSSKELVIVFCSMAMGQFLIYVDQTGITVALPYMAKDLHAEQTIAWAGTASLISSTVFAVLFGRFSDIFSRKYTLIASMLLLAFFDLGCALAQTATQLYVFRGFCGVGIAGITTLINVIVSDVVTLEKRGKYQGILGSCVGLGNAAGPFIASGFIQHTSWRKFYYTLFPLLITAAAVMYKLIPYTRPNNSMKEKIINVDYLGFLTSSISIVFLLIPVSGGGSTFKWDSAFTISFIIIGGCFFFLFLLVEWRVARLPMIPLGLFKTTYSLTTLLLQNFFFGIAYYSGLYYYPYYFQIIRGFSVTHTSCFLLAMVLPQSLASVLSGQVIARTKHFWYVICTGYSLWMIATGLINLWSTDNHIGINIATMIINGFGVGCVFQPTLVAAQAHSYKKDRATVISTRNVIRSLGGAIGLAISSTIIANSISSELSQHGRLYFSASEVATLKTLVYSKLDLTLYSAKQALYLRQIYMKALKRVFYVWMGSMAACLVPGYFIKDHGLHPIDEK